MAIAPTYINALNTVKKAPPRPLGPVIQPESVQNPVSPEDAQRASQGRAQDWLNNPKSGFGGYNDYVDKQNAKYATADESGRKALMADSQRVGYTLTGGGVVGGGVDVGSNTGSNVGTATGPEVVNDPNDPYAAKAKQYIDSIGSMQPFKYDQNTDPSYLALSQANTANAQSANRDMEEEMNSRGILNSTITSDRATDIYKQGADATTAAIPQLQANAYNQYQQNFTNTLNLANQYQNMSNNVFDKEMKTADVTGQWKDPQVNSLIQTVLDAKANYGKPGYDNKALSQTADIARGKLKEFNIDPALFGSNVTLAQAQDNVSKAWSPTMAAQTNNVNLITGLAAQYDALPKGTGAALVKGSPAYKAAADFYKVLEGYKTSKTLSREETAAIDKMQVGISSRNADIAQGHLDIAKDAAKQAILDKAATKESKKATDAVISNATSFDTKKEAYGYVSKWQDTLVKQGIDVPAVLDYISKLDKWDVAKTTSTGLGPDGKPLPEILQPLK